MARPFAVVQAGQRERQHHPDLDQRVPPDEAAPGDLPRPWRAAIVHRPPARRGLAADRLPGRGEGSQSPRSPPGAGPGVPRRGAGRRRARWSARPPRLRPTPLRPRNRRSRRRWLPWRWLRWWGLRWWSPCCRPPDRRCLAVARRGSRRAHPFEGRDRAPVHGEWKGADESCRHQRGEVSPSGTSSIRAPDGARRAATVRPRSGSPRAASRASSRAASAQRIVCATAMRAPNARARNTVSAHIASAASTVTAPVSWAKGERRVGVAGTTHSGAMEAAALPVIRTPPAGRAAPAR